MGAPTIAGAASSRTWRIWAPPGTSPAPVCPSSSVSNTTLRVKNGAWAPLRFSNMLSLPATGITRMLVIRGDDASSLLVCTTESISDLYHPWRVRVEHGIKAFFLILWSGEVGYVRPFFDGMAASGAVTRSTPLGKMH